MYRYHNNGYEMNKKKHTFMHAHKEEEEKSAAFVCILQYRSFWSKSVTANSAISYFNFISYATRFVSYQRAGEAFSNFFFHPQATRINIKEQEERNNGKKHNKKAK